MNQLISLFVLSLLLCMSCNSPKNGLQSSENKNIESEKETTDAAEEFVAVMEEPNTYMDPFDPDFISGKWEAEDQNGFSFGTWFYVEDGYVSGQYCAMNEDASRIDCGTQDEVNMCYLKSPYLVGKKILELEVVSCYAMKKGKATIEPYGDGQIKWKLTESPGTFGVDHFAPEEAILFKTSFDPWD
ncbi:hypothetical protein [Portibacter lacus]|nr:hypothetical protein [Portibacter lacus]